MAAWPQHTVPASAAGSIGHPEPVRAVDVEVAVDQIRGRFRFRVPPISTRLWTCLKIRTAWPGSRGSIRRHNSSGRSTVPAHLGARATIVAILYIGSETLDHFARNSWNRVPHYATRELCSVMARPDRQDARGTARSVGMACRVIGQGLARTGRWLTGLHRRRVFAIWAIATLGLGGLVWSMARWWPTGGVPDRWLERMEQFASIASALLTAAGVVLAYLALRGTSDSLRRRAQRYGEGVHGKASVLSERLPHPMQLPHDAVWFTGRTVELKHVLKVVQRQERAPTVVITVIEGMAGVGKTALAVHIGHRITNRYPDGHLFIDLRGFTQGVMQVEPDDALDRMLRALGVPGERIPAELDDRAALWRTVLAGRRMLIVLDNVTAETQVRPLLPGAPGCLVLVTSRHRLTGLDATHTISLDTLPTHDAVALFAHTAGRQELTKDSPELVDETVNLCGRLPLAIRIAAARLKSRPAWTVADLVERLRHHGQPLTELVDGPRSVTAALELSYQQLPIRQQEMYRLLSLHPGPSIEPYGAAALAGVTPEQAEHLLEALLDAHLLEEPVPRRYRYHDLVRAHAASHAADQETELGRQVALASLLDHYRHTAAVAMNLAHPYEGRRRPSVPTSDSAVPNLTDSVRANTWLDTELPNLLTAAQHAGRSKLPDHLQHLAALLHRHLRTRGRYNDATTLHRQALTAAAVTGNHTDEMAALDRLGQIHRLQGEYEQALECFVKALDMAHATHQPEAEMETRCGLGRVHWLQGRHDQALQHYEHALHIARTIAHSAGELDALCGLGRVHRMQGRYDLALECFVKALGIARITRHPAGELAALDGLGWVDYLRGQHEESIGHYTRILEMARSFGHRAAELGALRGLARAYRMQRRHDVAARHYSQALEIARTTGHRAVELSALVGLGHLHRLQGRYQDAAHHYQQVLDMAHEIGSRNSLFDGLHGFGRLHYAMGQPQLALRNHQRALDIAIELAQPADQARAHDGIARAYHTMKQNEQALQHWRHALDILTNLGTDHTEDEEATAACIKVHLSQL